MHFEGKLQYTGTLTLDCDFQGTVSTEDTLIVGSAGKVKAEVHADTVEISGKVWGDVKAKSRVRILSGGEVYGNIETPSISMEDGVVFEGQCTRPQQTGSSLSGSSSVSSDVHKVLGGASDVLSSEKDGEAGPGSKKEVEVTA